ncbi:hypothetical protein GA0070606_2619 [Micromonospora citrea]|uniref:Uncharacterized protein n=1 Tax=Micromonospora citrea TaxID=47855 RepID=A0A1C6URS6_9ACTN|nr:hypothetical protein [Micromonospora citrea]SCL56509.1 hypothetical protein GA0070606_2619 [Micromonospora citrea]
MTLPPRPGAPDFAGEAAQNAGLRTPAPPQRKTAIVVGVVAAVLMLCLCGVCAVVGGVVAFSDRGDVSEVASADDYSTDPTPTERPSPDDSTSSPVDPPETTESVPDPPARIGQCIVVNEQGDFLGIGNCNGTRGTYRVLSVDYSRGQCADPDSPYITEDGYRLCLELHLVRNYCYKIPKKGWIVGAVKCEAPGTVWIIDIVPGAKDDRQCTREKRWNRWYRFTNPTVVYCVMKY